MTRLGKAKMLVVVVAAASMVLAACGSDSKTSAAPALTALGKTLPIGIQKAGKIVVGSDIEYAPIEFFKEGTKQVQGVDYDLAQAFAKKLGVKFNFVNDTDFAGIITAMNAGRFDIIMSAMSDTKERQDAGVDFIDYFVAGSSMIVRKANPEKIAKPEDLCGKTVAVQKGTIQETSIVTPLVDTCAQTGAALTVVALEKDADALQQVKVGRAVANFEDFPVAAYNAQTSGAGKDFTVVGEQIGSGPYGIAVPKKQAALRDALAKALKAIIADGTYANIMEKWNVAAGGVKTVALNGGA